MREKESDSPLFWLFIAAVAVLAIAGYSGYLLYPRFDLPAATGVGLFVLAAAAGVASFFSPCSFPLLVTLLTRQATVPGSRVGRMSSLRFALALAGGASLFLLLAGTAIALGGKALFEGVTFTSTSGRLIRGVVGSLLVLLGLVQLNVMKTRLFDPIAGSIRPLIRAQARERRRRPFAGFAMFGFGYLLAGFG